MARQLEDLVGKRFSQMSRAEKLEFLQNLRQSRRTPKATSKVVKKKRRAQTKAVDKLEALFKSMTPEQQAKYLEGLKK